MTPPPVHPGVVLLERLEELGMGQAAFARRAGFSQKHVNQVVHGRARMSALFAVAVERTIQLPAHVLVRMQADYDLAEAEHAPPPILWRKP